MTGAEELPAAEDASAVGSAEPQRLLARGVDWWRRLTGWLRRAVHRRAVIVVGAAVLVAAVAGGVWGIVESRKIAVPDLIGLTVAEVGSAVEDIDLEVRSESALPDSALREYTTITEQHPAPGTRVFPGHSVLYGFELVDVEVPPVVGTPLGEAVEALAATGLVGEAASAQVPVLDEGATGGGLPADTDPAAITAGVRSLGITGTVDVTGAPFPLRGDADDTWVVVGSGPSPTSMIAAGSRVDLVVSLPLSVLPDVVGVTFAEAAEAFSAAGATAVVGDAPHFGGTVPTGFPFNRLELVASSSSSGEFSWGFTESDLLEEKLGAYRSWRVHSQSVPPGEVIIVGQDVDLVTEWPGTTVPNIVGLSPSDAIAALNAVGLSGRDIRTGLMNVVAQSQSFAPGTVLPVGASVAAELGAPSHEVTFRVTSTASRGTVTWAAPGSFSIEQAVGTRLPWSQTWSITGVSGSHGGGNFNAQMNGSGRITCEILVDGAVVETRTSSGAYAVVSCG